MQEKTYSITIPLHKLWEHINPSIADSEHFHI